MLMKIFEVMLNFIYYMENDIKAAQKRVKEKEIFIMKQEIETLKTSRYCLELRQIKLEDKVKTLTEKK